MAEAIDISDTLIAKSDQLNSDDLIAGPITVSVTAVKRAEAEQPIAISISGGHRPWFPCKTMRRVLASAWGKDATNWIGKSVKLYRDPKVKWGGEVVGGIRIAAMSHIAQKLEIALAETRGKKKLVTVERLESGPIPDTKTPPIESAFKAMKDRWKARRESLGMVVDVAEFGAFVESATSGLILAKDSRNLSCFTAEHIAHCNSEIDATLPEPL